MKPRITQGWVSLYPLVGVEVRGWYCDGHGAKAWGVKPADAYAAWVGRLRDLPGSVPYGERGVLIPTDALEKSAARYESWWKFLGFSS